MGDGPTTTRVAKMTKVFMSVVGPKNVSCTRLSSKLAKFSASKSYFLI